MMRRILPLLLLLTQYVWAQSGAELHLPDVRYTEYGKPVAFRVEAKVNNERDSLLYFRLAAGPRTAQLDSVTGYFVWQPTYRDEGRRHPVVIELRGSRGLLAQKTTYIDVADIVTRPQIQVAGFVNVEPGRTRVLPLQVTDPSGQKVRITEASSSNNAVLSVEHTDSTLTLRARQTPYPMSVPVSITAENQVDRQSQILRIEVNLVAKAEPPRFYEGPIRFEVGEGQSRTIPMPAYDPNGDRILYGFTAKDGAELGGQIRISDPEKGTFEYTANGIGDKNEATFTFVITASDNFTTTNREVTVVVRRVISLEEEQARLARYNAVYLNFVQLLDSTEKFHDAMKRYIRRKKLIIKASEWSLFGLSLYTTILTTQSPNASDAIKALSLASTAVSGFSALLKPDVSPLEADRGEALRMKNEMANLVAREDILHREQLTGFIRSGGYGNSLTELRIQLATYRYRYRQLLEKNPRVADIVLHRKKKGRLFSRR